MSSALQDLVFKIVSIYSLGLSGMQEMTATS